MLEINAGPFSFVARFEEELAPRRSRRSANPPARGPDHPLPLERRVELDPWGDRDLGIGPENATSYPHPGELALYPGGESETELLFPYGYCHFKSKAGELWANHFATLVEGQEQLKELGRMTPGKAPSRSRSASPRSQVTTCYLFLRFWKPR